VLGFTKARNGEKNCPARKNRKREDSDDFIKEIPPLQTPGRSSKKRQNHPILNAIPFFGKKLPLPRTLQSPPSGKEGGGRFGHSTKVSKRSER
jgi:hypothetical protein